MRAASRTAGTVGLMLLQARLQCRGGAVAGRMRGWANRIVAAGRGSDGAAHTHVHGERSALLEVGKVIMASHTIAHVNAGGHGHGTVVWRRSGKRRTMAGHVVALRSSLCQSLRLGRSKSGGGGGGSLFNCATVVVLVSGKSGTAREGLLAVGIGALVGSLS